MYVCISNVDGRMCEVYNSERGRSRTPHVFGQCNFDTRIKQDVGIGVDFLRVTGSVLSFSDKIKILKQIEIRLS